MSHFADQKWHSTVENLVAKLKPPFKPLHTIFQRIHRVPVSDLLFECVGIVTTNPRNHGFDLAQARHNFAITITRCGLLGLNLLAMFKHQVFNILGHRKVIPPVVG